MTLFERALGLFATSQKSKGNLELLKVADIVSSISNASNVWNRAAVLRAAEHEQNPGKPVTIICYPAPIKGGTRKIPKMTTLEWNALALSLHEKAGRNREEGSNISFLGALPKKTTQRP